MGDHDRTESTTCDTCGDTGRVPWMVESDPNCYQNPDDGGMVPCLDCRITSPGSSAPSAPEEGTR